MKRKHGGQKRQESFSEVVWPEEGTSQNIVLFMSLRGAEIPHSILDNVHC